jgi:hypothetical protein
MVVPVELYVPGVHDVLCEIPAVLYPHELIASTVHHERRHPQRR